MRFIRADDTPRELGSVGTRLNELLRKCAGDREASGGRILIIEVMLRHDQLCHEVERWELDQDRYKVLCGCKFPSWCAL